MLFAHHHKTVTAVWLWALVLFGAAGCTRTEAPDPRYVQPANLLEIINEFQRLSREDVYRFDIPKDVTGTNILKATLLRLEDYQRRHGSGYGDIVEFTRAAAYERLRDYGRAVRHYRNVARGGGELADPAKRQVEALETFQRISLTALPKEDPFEYIKVLDDVVLAWNALVREHEGTSLEYLARVEAEAIDRAKVAFVELNRHRLNQGNELVALGYSQLLSRHVRSRNYHRYLLDFGDYYVSLAREYSLRNDPQGLDFDVETFDGFARSAMKLYAEVAQQDGALEKIEAGAKLEGLKGLMERTRRLNR